MKLNVCCGKRYREGWTNVDIVALDGFRAPDILCNALSVPLADGVASEIMCIHGFEHFQRWEVDALLEEWKRLLQPGGLLALEMPDLIKCCENVISGFKKAGKHPDQFTLWGLYGDPTTKDEFMMHRWAYSPASLRAILSAHGFTDIMDAEPQWHPAGRERRDMRMEARRP